MNEKEIGQELDDIAEGMKLFDTMINHDPKTSTDKDIKWFITEKQKIIVKKLFNLFRSLRWQIAFNRYKELKCEESDPIKTDLIFGGKCGDAVKIRPCGEEYENKTYFGILIGDVALSIGHSIDKDGTVTAKREMYNPGILIPELGEVVYGCGSWWSKIESKEELDKLITDETIQNVWYVKLLKQMGVEE